MLVHCAEKPALQIAAPMLNRIRFAVPVFFALLALATPATAERITFVLMNDIYTMSEQVGADGKVRGGFARVAAVVKSRA